MRNFLALVVVGLVGCSSNGGSIPDGTYTVSQMYQLDTMSGFFRYQTYTQEAHIEDGVFYMWNQSFPMQDNGQGELYWLDEKEEYTDGRFSEIRLMTNYKENSFMGVAIAYLPSIQLYSWSTLKGVYADVN